MHFARSTSSVLAGITIASPLSLVSVNAFVIADASAMLIVVESDFPRSFSMCFAAASTLVSAIAVSFTSSVERSTSSGFLNVVLMNSTAASTSTARMRPSPSRSIRPSVSGSMSTPFTGIASATHSF
jgi:hypothetical protein